MMQTSIVVVGSSWGGLAAVSTLLGGLPHDFTVPVAIVQHRSIHSDNLLAKLLQDTTPLRVVEVDDKEPMEPSTVYIAPPNYHMLVDVGHFTLTTDPLVRFSRPSIDVTFFSAADSYPSSTIGIVLTGANDDGAKGLHHIVFRGGRAIVQDPVTAESPIMPEAARRAVPQAAVVPLADIARHLASMVNGVRTAPDLRTG